MNQYLIELSTHFIYALVFAIIVFSIIYLIYYVKRVNGSTLSVFLKENKIYIDIFFVICLTFMSISIATNANLIANNEIQIQKAANQPIFTFDKVSYGNGYFDKIIVYNEGAPVSNVFAAPLTYLTIYSYESGSYKEIVIPIDYYIVGTRGTTENDTRKLYELFNSDTEPEVGNAYIFSNFWHDFQDLKKKENRSIDVNLHEFVYMKYEDIYGDSHEELYVVSDAFPHKLNSYDKEEILKIIEESPYSTQMNKLNAEEVFTIFDKYST